MRRNASSLALVLAGAATAIGAAACGGGPTGPGKLRYTLDNQYIVGVSPSEQGGVLTAEQEVTIASKEKDKAEYDLKNVGLEVKIAGFEFDRAKLSVKIAEAKREAAAQNGVAMQNMADAEMRSATLGMQSAEAKRDFVKAKRSWLKTWQRYTVYGMFAAEAKLELEKAKVAKAKNNYPKGFDLAKYEEQARDRVSAANNAKQNAQDELKRAEDLRHDWQQKEQQYMAAMGLKGQPESAETLEQPKPTPEPIKPNVVNNTPDLPSNTTTTGGTTPTTNDSELKTP